MNIVFLGSPEPAVPTLRALVRTKHRVVGVVTQPDRRRGRGGALLPTPVKLAAVELGIPVWHDLSALEHVDAQRGVVVAYGKIIPTAVLDRIPMLNVHFSLLPRWRGAAPVERAILAGDAETGVCIMELEPTLDTGPVYARATTPIGDKTATELLEELANLGATALVDVLDGDELPVPVAQTGEPTYAAKLTSGDFWLSSTMSVEELLRVVRLGRAVTEVDGRRLRVHRAARSDAPVTAGTMTLVDDTVVLGARDGALRLDEVQAEGARRTSSGSWWHGIRERPTRWGDRPAAS